jgi:hypothetical protein
MYINLEKMCYSLAELCQICLIFLDGGGAWSSWNIIRGVHAMKVWEPLDLDNT